MIDATDVAAVACAANRFIGALFGHDGNFQFSMIGRESDFSVEITFQSYESTFATKVTFLQRRPKKLFPGSENARLYCSAAGSNALAEHSSRPFLGPGKHFWETVHICQPIRQTCVYVVHTYAYVLGSRV